MSDITIEVNSNFKWNLIFDYDNSNNSGMYSTSSICDAHSLADR